MLTVERAKTDKVANYINDCRRIGIEILPPDINRSDLDFTLEELPSDAPPPARDPRLGFAFPLPPRAAIRFGLEAVKNVGGGPVSEILHARQEAGAFASLEEFCERVDLRKVTKRPLECLIKVGAFDAFDDRTRVLAVLDRMMQYSAQTWEARDVGQASLFDLFDFTDQSQQTQSLFDPPPPFEPRTYARSPELGKRVAGRLRVSASSATTHCQC